MKKIYLLFLCLSTLVVSVWAENQGPKKTDANIFGHVLDKRNKEHLPYVTIQLRGTTLGTVTDASGHYFLKNMPEGKFTIEVKMVGYKTILQEVQTKANTTQEIDFELEEENITLNTVVVSANRNETNRMMAPSLVSVLDLKMLENTNSKSLAQALNFQPGLRVEQLSKLRIFSGENQWIGGSLLTNTDRLASYLRCTYRRLRTGTNTLQHDRPGRGDPWRRICTLRLIGNRRGYQCDYQRTHPKQRRHFTHALLHQRKIPR